jgi:predicted ATP-dependent Lon-type protease
VSGVSFDQKDGVNIMKGFMESGEFSRGRDSIRAEGSIVLLGNFDVMCSISSASATCSVRCRRRCATTPR